MIHQIRIAKTQFFKRVFVLFCFVNGILLNALSLPDGPFPDAIFDKNIKTVQFYKEGWEFSYPILSMNEATPLLFSFDDLDEESKYYSYSIVFCDADWMPSRLTYSEYLDGFYQNQLTNYETSQSTKVAYQHYSLKIPNNDVKPKLPGNYLLVVYNKDDDHPVIMKRFVVVEQMIDFFASVRRPVTSDCSEKCQEIDFTLSHPNFSIENPYQTLKVVIVKNGQWKFAHTDLKPIFVRNNEMEFNFNEKNVFAGGNEFRAFDTKNLKFAETNVKEISFDGRNWNVLLKPDAPRDRGRYVFQEDLNGRYLIQNKQGTEPNVDAEYTNVTFSFPVNEPFLDGSMYVWGAMTDYNCYEDYKMAFDIEQMSYKLTALLKQGYYNYQYVYVPNKTQDVNETYFEGNFHETENTYLIYVYYKPFGTRFDRLIGISIFNTMQRKIIY